MILTEFHKPVNQVYSTLFICLVLMIVCLIVGLKVRKLDPKKKTPKWLVPFLVIVKLMNNMSKENFGKRWKAYAPYLLTLTLFIFFSNISGVFGIVSPTSYLILDVILALSAFFVVEITGLVSMGPKNFLKSFLGASILMSIIMVPINIISEITLPVSLSLRIMGNVTSGGVIGSVIKGLPSINGWLFPVSVVATPVINFIFDIFSGTIQTLVFVLLTTTYTAMKIDPKDLEDVSDLKVAKENN